MRRASWDRTARPLRPQRCTGGPGPLATALLLSLALVAAGCSGGHGRTAAQPAGTAGTAGGAALGSAPLLARTPSGFRADLAALKGRVVVVNFWASWCGPCKGELPLLEKASVEYHGKPVTFVGVDSLDVRDNAAKAIRTYGITYPTVYDRASGGGIAADWEVSGLPQTWFIARDGSPAGRVAHALTAADLHARIEQLLVS